MVDVEAFRRQARAAQLAVGASPDVIRILALREHAQLQKAIEQIAPVIPILQAVASAWNALVPFGLSSLTLEEKVETKFYGQR